MDIVISFLIAAIMGMGIGGGGFLVIYLTLCLGYEQILAQGTNLVFFAIASVFAIIVHLFKRKISLKQVLLMSAFGSLGAFLASGIVNRIDPKIPRIALGVLLVGAGILSIYNTLKKEKNKNK
ncbi:MAG: sulfite exporter TauE/SafE family protein [Clostridia bacterium]|nr:sulfite exporter TauE/SafE family protein [Clostridia bacterium]